MGLFPLASVVLIAGTLGGALARPAKLPGITGNILIGVLIDPHDAWEIIEHAETRNYDCFPED